MTGPRWLYFYLVFWMLIAAMFSTYCAIHGDKDWFGNTVLGLIITAFVGGMILRGLWDVRERRQREARWKENERRNREAWENEPDETWRP